MDRHEYMTTGEFASAMGVSKDTLFHYDDIGLFCPEKVSENGYRYYSRHQLESGFLRKAAFLLYVQKKQAFQSFPGALAFSYFCIKLSS